MTIPGWHSYRKPDENREDSPYRHWYKRKDKTGNPTRDDADSPTELLEVAFELNNQISNKLMAPKRDKNWAATSDFVDLPDVLKQLTIEQTDAELIVGVIDTDIPLGHRAFRNADGTTRIMHHWATGHKPDKSDAYGTSFSRDDINRLLKKYSPGGDLLGPLDEDGFNRAVGALDFGNLGGQRALGRRHSHGAHMLDVAGGCDPKTDPEFASKVGLITVAMPSRWEFGEGGEFLDQHMINAVYWLYDKAKQQRRQGQDPRLPTVASLAFGRQAGAKREDTDPLSQFLRELEKEIKDDADSAPFELVIPAGNDNLSRCVARYVINAGKARNIDWRIVPGDQTDNYLEIWVEQLDDQAPSEMQLAVDLIPPGAKSVREPMLGPPGTYYDIENDAGKFGARIYRFQKPPTRSTHLTGYLMSLGPVVPRGESIGAVRPGAWTVRMKNTSEKQIVVHLSVQTDQSIHPVAHLAGRSYLDDANYQRFDSAGRGLDAIRWTGCRWESTETAVGTRRHGTMNVAASQTITAVVGGYRTSDGLPASYSSSGLGISGDEERAGPTAALPTDDSKILGGTLAAGSKDGSRVAMRGTSFAASKATRVVVNEWLKNSGSRGKSAKSILKASAKDFEFDQQIYEVAYDLEDVTHNAARAKFGNGRIPFDLDNSARHRKG